MANLPVPVPRTFQPNEVEAAAYLNSVRDGLSFLTAPPIAVLTQSAAQTLVNNSAAAVTLDATTVDTYGGHSNTTNNTRYTAVVAGWYWIRGGVAFAPNGTGDRGIQINKNGTQLTTAWNVGPTSGAAFAPGREVSTPVFLNAGDYVEVVVIQTSGANLNTFAGSVTSSMSVWWMHS